MTALVVHPVTRPLAGSVPVPSDIAIGHRALLIAALCEGQTRLAGFSPNGGNAATAGCLRALGVAIDEPDAATLVVHGAGLRGLHAAVDALDCGNAEATLRLLCGALAAQRFRSLLVGSPAVSASSVADIVKPLRTRGALFDSLFPPLGVGPVLEGRVLGPLEHETAGADPLLKGAILLSGLDAEGVTRFREATVSPDHTERMLGALGVPIRTAGPVVELDPARWDGRMMGFDVTIPGDLSAAAFLLVAAQIVPESRVTLRAVGVNPTRTGLLEIARDMGAGLAMQPQGERHGEPLATVHAWAAPLRAIVIGGETVPRAAEDIPIACALAARARGDTALRDLDELRGRHRDRVVAMARVLRAFGVACAERPGGLDITGHAGPLQAARIDSRGDPAIAMTAAVLALVGRGPSRIDHAEGIAARYPKFVATLRALGARIDVE